MKNERKDFWKNIPEDCQKAIKELNRLKVSGMLAIDYEETFADVWWLVLHEVDMYAEGEFCQEASRSQFGEGDPFAMNIRNAQAADRWLVKWLPLFNKYKDNKYYSEYYWKIHSGFSQDDFYYEGQVI